MVRILIMQKGNMWSYYLDARVYYEKKEMILKTEVTCQEKKTAWTEHDEIENHDKKSYRPRTFKILILLILGLDSNTQLSTQNEIFHVSSLIRTFLVLTFKKIGKSRRDMSAFFKSFLS